MSSFKCPKNMSPNKKLQNIFPPHFVTFWSFNCPKNMSPNRLQNILLTLSVNVLVFRGRQIFWLHQLLPCSEKKTISCFVLHQNSSRRQPSKWDNELTVLNNISSRCFLFKLLDSVRLLKWKLCAQMCTYLSLTSFAINCDKICEKGH